MLASRPVDVARVAKVSDCTWVKISTPKQMLQRLPIKVKCKVGAIFMNSRNSKTSDTYGLLLNLLDEINLRISNKYVALWSLNMLYSLRNIRRSYKDSRFKISVSTRMKKMIRLLIILK